MKLRIFVVDDEPSIRETLAYCLRELGHEVIPAASATFCTAFSGNKDSCQADMPCGDILIIDQNMPQMKGLEFIAQQRTSGRNIALVTAVLSANLEEHELRQARALNCETLKKPITFSALTEWVKKTRTKIPGQRKLIPRENLCCCLNDSPASWL